MLALLFSLSLPAVTARLYSSDEVQYFSYLRSLWFDRDVSFENEYRYFYDHNIAQSEGYHETFLERQTAAGRRVNYGTIGCAILWSPFYAAADLWTWVRGGTRDGFSKPYIRAVAYGSALYGFLAVLLSIRAARVVIGHRGNTGHGGNTEETLGNTGHSRNTGHSGNTEGTQGDGSAYWAGLAVWLGTPLLFYMYVAPPFSHAVSAFGVALFVTVWLHVRRGWTPRGMFALGVCAALVGMIREQDVFIALGPAVDFALALSTPNSHRLRQGYGESVEALRAKAELPTPREPRGWLRAAASGFAGFVLGYAPQLVAYNGLNGYPGPASHVTRKMFWHAPHGLQVLFSPHHGFFFWTPLAVLSIAALVMMVTGRLKPASTDVRRIALCTLLMIASQVYVAGSVASWTVAGAFGQRRFVCLTPLLIIGLAGLWHSRPGGACGSFLTGLMVLSVWWNVALTAQFATGLMDRQRLELGRNAYHAFVTLPRIAPTLAYRYFTDRASFYKPPSPPDAGR